MNKIVESTLRLIEIARTRTFALSLLCVLFTVIVFNVTDRVGTVSVQDKDGIRTIYTMGSDPVGYLSDSAVVALAYDASEDEDLSDKLLDNGNASLFPAYVEADGKMRKVMIAGGTVGELISRANIELGEMDEVSLPLDSEVKSGDVAVVTRKEYVTVTNKTEIPFETRYTHSSDLTPGAEKIKTEGKEGLRVEVIRQLIVNGEIVEEIVKSDTIEREPVKAEVLMGFPVHPVSPYDFDATFDENGEPIEYTQVLRNQKAAGYTAPSGSKTASGRKAAVGNVAVDPSVIPYGSKLFIISTNGKHIYGYAIAADTGTSLLNGTIAVDLFYDTHEECVRNGIRKVDIYILE